MQSWKSVEDSRQETLDWREEVKGWDNLPGTEPGLSSDYRGFRIASNILGAEATLTALVCLENGVVPTLARNPTLKKVVDDIQVSTKDAMPIAKTAAIVAVAALRDGNGIPDFSRGFFADITKSERDRHEFTAAMNAAGAALGVDVAAIDTAIRHKRTSDVDQMVPKKTMSRGR